MRRVLPISMPMLSALDGVVVMVPEHGSYESRHPAQEQAHLPSIAVGDLRPGKELREVHDTRFRSQLSIDEARQRYTDKLVHGV